MAISLAIYAALFLAGMVFRRGPAAAPQETATAEEIQAAREQLEKRQVRMVYLPPAAQPRQQPPAPARWEEHPSERRPPS